MTDTTKSLISFYKSKGKEATARSIQNISSLIDYINFRTNQFWATHEWTCNKCGRKLKELSDYELNNQLGHCSMCEEMIFEAADVRRRLDGQVSEIN